MSKYKWYKRRKPKSVWGNRTWPREIPSFVQPMGIPEWVQEPADQRWRQELQGQWIGQLGAGDIIRPVPADLNTQQLSGLIEREMRENLDGFIGGTMGGDTNRAIEAEVLGSLNSFRYRGLIEDHRIDIMPDGNMNITITPTTSIDSINLTIQLDNNE